MNVIIHYLKTICLTFAILMLVGKVSYAESSDSTSYQYSEAELAQILAPIALYPDTLLSHILIASTYPLEVVEAQRFIANYRDISKQRLSQKIDKKAWDASVKALTNFPRIINQLSDDLSWMQQLASAFLADESAVLSSIQALRHQAEQAGNLDKLSQLTVEKDNQLIIIHSASPEVVYVPYYDTRVVYGHWRWHRYPPVYWHAPVSVSLKSGPFYWYAGIHLTGDFFFSAFHWHNRRVVIHQHRHHYHGKKYYRKRTTSYHGKHWQHKSYGHKKYHHKHKSFSRRAVSAYGKRKHHHVVGRSLGSRYKKHQAKRLSHRIAQQKAKHHVSSHHGKTNSLTGKVKRAAHKQPKPILSKPQKAMKKYAKDVVANKANIGHKRNNAISKRIQVEKKVARRAENKKTREHKQAKYIAKRQHNGHQSKRHH